MLTQEAMKHFKLFRNPFINDIRAVRDIYMNEDSRYVLAAMKDVARNQGILAVVGDSGAGKSVLRRLLLDELHNDGDISVINPKSSTRRAPPQQVFVMQSSAISVVKHLSAVWKLKQDKWNVYL